MSTHTNAKSAGGSWNVKWVEMERICKRCGNIQMKMVSIGIDTTKTTISKEVDA